jgi:short-subunit dehydrogenase
VSRIEGSTVLVTGGATGLGRLFAIACLRDGAAGVILWDIDREALSRTAAELRAEGHLVHDRVVDVASEEQIAAAARADLAEVSAVDILFNNAGIVVGKPFAEHEPREIERTVRVNVLGVMHVARAFLPSMISRGSGHIVNMASAASYLPNPNMAVYVASKWAVMGWSESLRLELEALGRDLHVTSVAPSYVDTGMFEGAKAPLLTPILQPEDLVARILRAVKSDRIVLRAPALVHLLPMLRGILPLRFFDWFVGRVFGVYKTMDHFVGHGGPAPTASAGAEQDTP